MTDPAPRKQHPRTGIRLRAALFVFGLVALMVLSYTLLVSPSISSTLARDETDKLELEAKVVAEQIEDTLSRALHQLESAAALPSLATMDVDRLNTTLTQLDTTTPFFLFFMVLDPDGVVQARPSKAERVGAMRANRKFVSVPLATGRTHLSSIEISPAGHLSLVAGTPIRRDGQIVGILAGSLGLMDRNSRLYHAVVEPVQSAPMEAYLLAANGEVIATSTELVFSDNLVTRPRMADAPVDGTAAMKIDGRGWLVAAREIQALSWRVVVRVPQQLVDDKVAIISARFRLVGWICAAGILLIGLVVAEASARPLTRLAKALARYGQAGAVQPVAISGPRELAATIEAFNQMMRERDQAAQEREGLKSQLVQSQKLQTIGTLAGGIAHDFNNFLTPVLFCGQRLMRMLPDDDDRREMAESIVTSAEGARELASRLLNFSHTTESTRGPHDMAALVNQAMSLVNVSMPSSIQLVTKIDEQAGWALVDRIQIQQVLLNLTGNAVAAMHGTKGTLTIELRRSDDGEAILMSVADTGKGMDSEALSRVFEPFYTTKPVGEGTGLGLAVVKGIITEHEARIEIESEPAHGTRFKVFLARLRQDEESNRDEQPDRPDKRVRGRVLVVDDDRFVAHAMALVLEDLGFEVQIEYDPATVLMQFQRGSYSVDLMLVDQHMPRLTGLDLARAVRKEAPQQELLIMTGRPDDKLESACKELGLMPPLPKPFPDEVLEEAIESALARARAIGRPARARTS